MIVIGQKSGVAFAMDPEKSGEILWQYRAGQGSALGGIEWGAATDGEHAYFAVSDILTKQPGGLHAVNLETGTRVGHASTDAKLRLEAGCNGAQSAAVTAIAGAVFSGSNDGSLRAYSTSTGEILWEFDSNRDFTTVNAVPAKGRRSLAPAPSSLVVWCTSTRDTGRSAADPVTCYWPLARSSPMRADSLRSVVFLAAVALWCAGPALSGDVAAQSAASPTFSRDVAPIFYNKCVSCHRPGEVAPMSLITYRDVRHGRARSVRR